MEKHSTLLENELAIFQLQELVKIDHKDWKTLGEIYARETDKLVLFKYLPTAEYSGIWNPVERVARGLILEKGTGKLVARPFDKFFNWNQAGKTTEAPVDEVYEKLDGSLGIIYWHDGKWNVATNGAFESDQAKWATTLLNQTVFPDWITNLCGGTHTIMVEIIYPENRVVVDYGDYSGFVLLAIRDNESGDYSPYETLQTVSTALNWQLLKRYDNLSIEDIVQTLPLLSGNEEGFVVTFQDGLRFKFKGEEYLKLHRLKSEITRNNVLEIFRNNEVDKYKAGVPNEFLIEFNLLVDEFEMLFKNKLNEVVKAYMLLFKSGKTFASKKDFALEVLANHKLVSKFMFKFWDGSTYVEVKDMVRKSLE